MNGVNLLLDTNILIYLFSGHDHLFDFLKDTSISVSIISEIEILSFPNLDSKGEKKIKDFFKSVELIRLNDQVKELSIQIKKSYKLKLPDAVIAATAFYKNIPLVSTDTDFEKIEELNLIKYEL